jgi:hypothetical protein
VGGRILTGGNSGIFLVMELFSVLNQYNMKVNLYVNYRTDLVLSSALLYVIL